ncbi:Lin1244/Lin1753 domain-containing protein, partial [Clostridium neonatale]|uniref:Lin1244/Lin1753 domain-containing protein n=2 Tax=Clostridium TaxID=1485 RepID=UPI0029374496
VGDFMARPIKEGLEYFPLDCDIDQDDKITLIEAQHGLIGFGIAIKLLMKIYNNSYFYEWTEKEQLLFSKRVNVNINEVNVVINDLVKWGFFDKNLFETEKILTSSGIQKRYLAAVGRRQKVKILKKYLLLDKETVNVYKNLVIVDNNSSLEVVNDDIGTQSKVKKSKVKESKENNNNDDDVVKTENNIFYVFENCGFGSIDGYTMQLLEGLVKDFTFEWTKEAIEIAAENGARNLKYVTKILENWKSKGKDYKPNKNNINEPKPLRFNNFEPREYDYDKLEKKLLGWDDD